MLPLLLVVIMGGGLAADGWHSDLMEGRESGKMLLIDFRADWCAPCRTMERDVYTAAFIASASQRFTLVRIDYDRQRTVARKYNVEELPTVIFTDSWGGEMFRHTGTLSARTMAEVLQALPARIDGFNRLEETLARDRNNVEALIGMGDKLRSAGLFLASNTYYRRALARRGADRERIRRGMAMNDEALRL